MSAVRWFSEREHPLGPPTDGYGCAVDANGDRVPLLPARDTRTWVSIEWAERHDLPVPENWRELH